MRPTRPSHAQQGTQTTRKTPAKAVESIPATHFRPHFVVGGGDCLFHALRMGHTDQLDVPVTVEHIMNLRQDAANYVAKHRPALIAHPSLGGEAGVNALYGLLITQGQWNENAGDLVPPILARVLGREIRILEPTHHGGSYGANENRTFRPQDTDTGLPPAKPDTGQPPIYLAHINNAHYEYLEPRDPQADATSESIIMDSVEYPSDASSLGSTSTTRWLDQLLDEKTDDDNVGHPPSPQGSSFGRVSSLSSLESYSSRAFLEKFTAEEKNSPTDDGGHLPSLQGSSFGRMSSFSSLESYSSRAFLEKFTAAKKNSPTEVIGQPSKKRSRHTERRLEEKDKIVKNPAHPSLGKRRVRAKAASHEIMKTQTGKGTKQVRTHKARNEITKALTDVLHNRSFDTLTPVEQVAEIIRISQKTGYSPSGVRTTLNGQGNKQVKSQVARNEIINTFTDAANNRSFDALIKEEQEAEVMRVSRVTGYNPSAVRITLAGGGTNQVTSQADITNITNAFTETNNRPFDALTTQEKTAEVARISRKTGYKPLGVLTTLTGEGNKRVRTQVARAQITNAFTESNNRPFDALTTQEKTAEVTRISRKTGYKPFGVLTTLNGGGNKPVTTPEDKNEITAEFAETNKRSFNAQTSRGDKRVRTKVARAQITNAFTEANNRPFDALTKEEKTAEVTRISRKTGYRSSGVMTTLTGGGNIRVGTQATRNKIINAFTEANNRPFDALKKEEQDTEVTRISRKTGYNPSGVRTTLNKRASAKPK